VSELLDDLTQFLQFRWQELSFSILIFASSSITLFLLTRYLGARNSDEIGMKILEEFENQSLIRIKNPGNLRVLYEVIPANKNLVIKFGRFSKPEFDYAISLLKQLAARRGNVIIKLDIGLFLLRPQGEEFASYSDSARGNMPILDFSGEEVSAN